jgi:flavin-dependent dehydrogenase
MTLNAPDRLGAPKAVDFLVLGGGPAGSSFAILAARAGASVAIVERHGFTDHRPGEQISGSVRGALGAMAIPPAAGASFSSPSRGIVSVWAAEAPLTKSYRTLGQPEALRVVRNRFDAMLFDSAQTAGAFVLVPAALHSVCQRRNGPWRATVAVGGEHVSLSAAAIVDATGRAAAFSRDQGARRSNHGDLFALIGWLPATIRGYGKMLSIEACPCGWWSAAATPDDHLVVSLFTSAAMMKSARAELDDWWRGALSTAPYTRQLVGRSDVESGRLRIFPAFPSISSVLHGARWIAIGDAAAAFDPLCGQGVELALESAFRAFEAMSADDDSGKLGLIYQSAITDRYRRHLMRRAEVYAEAADSLSTTFIINAVAMTSVHDDQGQEPD